VGEKSKLVLSFERLCSIVRKRRQGREKTENEQNMRLEEMVREVMTQHAAEKRYSVSNIHETELEQTVDHKCHAALVQEMMNLQRFQQSDGTDYTPVGQEVEENRNSQSENNQHSPTFPRVVNSIVTGELEERKYSVSCHEALNKHAEDKRYSLMLPKSMLNNVQESEDDEHYSPSTKKGPLSDQEDSLLRPLMDKQLSHTTQQTESKGEIVIQVQVIWLFRTATVPFSALNVLEFHVLHVYSLSSYFKLESLMSSIQYSVKACSTFPLS
jgi:hypothetical protein